MEPTPEMMLWLAEKLADAERQLQWRKEEARTWRSGTNAEWASAANLHPSTAGNKLSKAARLTEAARHERIAIKCQREVDMYRAVLAALGMETLSGKPLR